MKLRFKPPTTAIPVTKLLNCPGGSAAVAWHEIHAVTPRLLWRSEVVSSVDSPQRGGAGHLTTANKLSQGWWSKTEANHLDPHQSKRLFFLLFVCLTHCCFCFLLLCVPFISLEQFKGPIKQVSIIFMHS